MTQDILPTVLELCGAPSIDDRPLDGVSLVPVLQDPTAALDRRTLFWHYPHYGNQGGAPSGAIRDGDWKLVEWFEDDSVELFDLATDPGETTNLAPEHPHTAARLRSMLRGWRLGVGAAMPTPNPEPTPAP